MERPIRSLFARRAVASAGALLIAGIGLWTVRRPLVAWAASGGKPPRRQRTVADALATFGEKSRRAYAPLCRAARIAYPPRRLQLLAFKEERRLEVWGADAKGKFRFLKGYDVLAASGGPGVKRREGDFQVPEGFYRLTTLNPNSRFHLSIRVDYPNREDVTNAAVPRGQMGGDIYIHGGAKSIGCLALGDPAIEELFCLVARSDPDQRRVLIAPVDLRDKSVPPADAPWVRDLYGRLAAELAAYKRR